MTLQNIISKSTSTHSISAAWLFRLFAVLILVSFFSACSLSFAGISIDYEKTKTFGIEQFQTRPGNAPPTAGQLFSEALKTKVLNQTRLEYKNIDPDLQFSGAITKYELTALAPQEGETTALQRLTMGVSVTMERPQDENAEPQTWNFSRFEDFSASTNLASVQDQLIRDIYEQVLEDVFNKAFNDW